MSNYLNGVRCLYNTDTYTMLELDTDYGKKIVRLPYEIVESQKGNWYKYPMSVKDYCRTLGIKVKDYFNFVHKDCN